MSVHVMGHRGFLQALALVTLLGYAASQHQPNPGIQSELDKNWMISYCWSSGACYLEDIFEVNALLA